MISFLMDNLWIVVTGICLAIVYFYFKKQNSKEISSYFLKDKKTLRQAKISEIKSISHDTIKITMDFPDIYSTLGLPLGTPSFISKPRTACASSRKRRPRQRHQPTLHACEQSGRNGDGSFRGEGVQAHRQVPARRPNESVSGGSESG